MKQIRAKVIVQEHRKTHYQPNETTMIARAVYPTTAEVPEDRRFHEATPAGEISLTMKNAVAAEFPLGATYYVDFTRADVPDAAAE